MTDKEEDRGSLAKAESAQHKRDAHPAEWRAGAVSQESELLISRERDTDVQWVPAAGHWLWPRWVDLAEGCAALLGVDVEVAAEEWDWQLARYSPGQFYGSHQDMWILGRPPGRERKLSICVLLEGPSSLKVHGVFLPFRPGDAVAFPSWMGHEVQSAEAERWSLVGWVEGPSWR
ncbi:MAG: 2OG-Fe(II) oxygenase [Acidobacteriota bacterium]|nr:2OG-Fe(II) oxygenase [Acidobacteriota bacterium]